MMEDLPGVVMPPKVSRESLSRRALWVIIVVLILALAGLLFWQLDGMRIFRHQAASTEQAATTDVKGKVIDYVSDLPLKGATVKFGAKTIQTDEQGAFTLAAVPVGDAEVTVSMTGYTDTTKKLTALATSDNEFGNVVAAEQLTTVALTPVGSVVFVSNRDGKRGLYVTDFSGKDTKPLVARSGETEDYDAILGPNGNKVVFLSTRDKRELTNSKDFDPVLYMVDVDGKNLTKVASSFNISSVRWSKDGQYLAWVGKAAQTDQNVNVYLWKLGSKAPEKMNASGTAFTYQLNANGTAIAWAQDKGSGDPTATKGIYYRLLSGGTTALIAETGSLVSFADNDASLVYSYYDDANKKSLVMKHNIVSGQKTETKYEYNSQVTALSPKGDLIASAESRDGQRDIYLTDKDGKNERRLTKLGTVVSEASWDKTGAYVLFDISKTGETARYIVAVAGGEPKKIADVYQAGGREGGN